MEIAAKHLGKDARIYVILGDSELGEGSTWEAFQLASHFHTDNLCATIDRNKFSCDGPTEGDGRTLEEWGGIQGTLCLEPIDKKLQAFGWHVITCDGHSIEELLDAYEEAAKTRGKPTMIIAHTVKGKGISFIEEKPEWHIGEFTPEQSEQALNELGSVLKTL